MLDRRGVLRRLSALGGASALGAGTPLRLLAQQAQGTGYVNVKDFGAKGDGSTDDTQAIQRAMDAVTREGGSTTRQGGGTLFFPPGSYVVRDALTVNGSNLWIQGVGKRNAQLPAWLARTVGPAAAAVPSTLYLTTANSGFVFPNRSFCNGFRASGLTLVGPGLPPPSRPPGAGAPPLQSAFRFELTGGGQFNRDFVFEDLTISGCQVAFNLAGSANDASQGAAGVIRVVRCSVQHNQWIALTGPGLHWNGFVYHQNDAGQNGFSGNAGGIDIAGESVSICDNVLEGTRNAVRVRGDGGFQGVEVRNNYFEANPGDYCVCIDGCPGPWVVGPNSFNPPGGARVVPAAHNVLIRNSSRGVCHDPAWLQACVNVQTPEPGVPSAAAPWLGLNNAATDWCLRVDTQVFPFTRPPAMTAGPPLYARGGEAQAASPFDGSPMPVVSGSTAGGTVSFPGLALQVTAAATGRLWLVGTIALRRGAPAAADPTLALAVSGATVLAPAGGRVTLPIPGYQHVVRAGEWALLTFAVPVQLSGGRQLAASVQVQPYGGGGALPYDVRPPIVYLVADINDARPYFDPYQARA